ncbi:MAG TPA: hypothetical protein VJJ98_07535 [Sedimentisphaerales bacterium]|nr:hypothetical protein [Sedimentisphaerales bacterium]
MKRRDFMKLAAGTAVISTASVNGGPPPGDTDAAQIKAYLRKLMPTREQVDNFLQREQGACNLSRNDGWTYDSGLGWVLCNSVRGHGVDGTIGFYSYEADGARKVINHADKPCRIHTYGNSFTHCDQVSDGETWQEYLAAHIQEPIRNYGVGGYGVYQAYLRMLKVEEARPAEHVILNIWDDDHYRNLDSWRATRFGQRTFCGYTLPFLRVNVAQNRCEKKDNLLPKPEDVYKLTDEEFVWETFKDDPVLHVMLALHGGREAAEKLLPTIADSFGFPPNQFGADAPEQAIRKMHTEASLFASKNIVTWTEQFAREAGKDLILILSFGQGNIAAALRGQKPFDQTFLDWLKDKPYPIIDMRDSFRAEYQQFKTDVDTYLRRYYIGHHNPAGNFFTAWSIKDRITTRLDPPPPVKSPKPVNC